MKKIAYFYTLLAWCLIAIPIFANDRMRETTQLLVVVTDDWDDFRGTMYRYEKNEGQWQTVGSSWSVVIGRTGLAWGRGEVAEDNAQMRKNEGDGKSPAGIFRITPMLYGYAAKAPAGVVWPYTQLTDDWQGVDDPQSQYYNQVLNRKQVVDPDWNSHEDMRRRDHLYRWLLIIEHNVKNTIAGAGSCIFLHLWRAKDSPTAGCTALSEENFLDLIRWLNPSCQPRIVQLPKKLYENKMQNWQLPALE